MGFFGRPTITLVDFPFPFFQKRQNKIKNNYKIIKNLQNILGEDLIWITPPHLQDFCPQKLQLPSILFYDQQVDSML
jgi:hypothetical protein